MNEKEKLQIEIKAMQKYREKANELIEKLNMSTREVNASADMEIARIKKRIEKDLIELSQYVSNDIPSTKRISLSHYVEKQKKDNREYPIAHFKIYFDGKPYSVNESVGVTEYKIAIVEECHSYAAVYADGLWADNYPEVARRRSWGKDMNINNVTEILCRNWNEIINGAYTEIKRAYKEDTEKKLKDTLQKQENSVLRYETLSGI
ncbi:MAG: hypothetical protein UHN47_07125 [Lachnospiraceae bacterium]|nr:hypothetical protein [Lachnospiraceae bacterium]